jgi:hypothetical protein
LSKASRERSRKKLTMHFAINFLNSNSKLNYEGLPDVYIQIANEMGLKKKTTPTRSIYKF